MKKNLPYLWMEVSRSCLRQNLRHRNHRGLHVHQDPYRGLVYVLDPGQIHLY